uniref:Uncharacterized protein n=1 Tax=Strigamia maritima TaxID=126957 RepID=T1IP48_STRMM
MKCSSKTCSSVPANIPSVGGAFVTKRGSESLKEAANFLVWIVPAGTSTRYTHRKKGGILLQLSGACPMADSIFQVV